MGILTVVFLKSLITYTDDTYSFKLSRGRKPSMVLACIPNGELSNLFGYDIIKNFKTYNYYTATDGEEYASVPIPKVEIDNGTCEQFVENYCKNKGFLKTTVELDRTSKVAYYDSRHKCIWWLTSESNQPVIRAVKSGSTARLENEILRDRFDSHNNPWSGYKELPIPEEL